MDVSGQLYVTSALTPEERSAGTELTEGWVGSKVCLAVVAKRKNFLPMPGVESQSSSR